jgi:hypothetical protein
MKLKSSQLNGENCLLHHRYVWWPFSVLSATTLIVTILRGQYWREIRTDFQEKWPSTVYNTGVRSKKKVDREQLAEQYDK